MKDIEQDGTAISAMVEAGGQGDVLFVLRNTSDGVVGYTCSPSSKKGIGIHPWKLEGKDLEAKNVKNGEKVTCPSAITTAFRGADKRVHIWDANVDYVCEEAVKPIEGGGKRTQRVLVVARKEARPRPQHKNI